MTLRLALPMILLLLQTVYAHMQMSWPYPIRSKFDPETSSSLVDYSYTAPLMADGSNFPCKGYHKDTPLRTVATYQAGSKYNMTLTGTAVHNGGSCQLSLSYDNGQTFKVIQSMIGGCPITKAYDFTIPQYAPAGNALFAWTWFNMAGNREMYMDCAQIAITSVTPSRVRRHVHPRHHHRSTSSMASLPNIFIANVNQADQCATTEGSSVVFANPGDTVIHGKDSAASSGGDGYTCAKAQASGYPSSDSQHKGAAQNVGAGASSSDTPAPASTTASSVVASPMAIPTDTAASSVSAPSPTSNATTSVVETSSASITTSSPPLETPTNSTLPDTCVPNTIYCNTAGTFSLCDPSPSTSSPYTYMGSVADGTQCIDGAIQRQNEGTCTVNGGVKCGDGGRTWLVCVEGGEVGMGSVAGGMVCRDGMVVATS